MADIILRGRLVPGTAGQKTTRIVDADMADGLVEKTSLESNDRIIIADSSAGLLAKYITSSALPSGSGTSFNIGSLNSGALDPTDSVPFWDVANSEARRISITELIMQLGIKALQDMLALPTTGGSNYILTLDSGGANPGWRPLQAAIEAPRDQAWYFTLPKKGGAVGQGLRIAFFEEERTGASPMRIQMHAAHPHVDPVAAVCRIDTEPHHFWTITAPVRGAKPNREAAFGNVGQVLFPPVDVSDPNLDTRHHTRSILDRAHNVWVCGIIPGQAQVVHTQAVATADFSVPASRSMVFNSGASVDTSEAVISHPQPVTTGLTFTGGQDEVTKRIAANALIHLRVKQGPFAPDADHPAPEEGATVAMTMAEPELVNSDRANGKTLTFIDDLPSPGEPDETATIKIPVGGADKGIVLTFHEPGEVGNGFEVRSAVDDDINYTPLRRWGMWLPVLGSKQEVQMQWSFPSGGDSVTVQRLLDEFETRSGDPDYADTPYPKFSIGTYGDLDPTVTFDEEGTWTSSGGTYVPGTESSGARSVGVTPELDDPMSYVVKFNSELHDIANIADAFSALKLQHHPVADVALTQMNALWTPLPGTYTWAGGVTARDAAPARPASCVIPRSVIGNDGLRVSWATNGPAGNGKRLYVLDALGDAEPVQAVGTNDFLVLLFQSGHTTLGEIAAFIDAEAGRPGSKWANVTAGTAPNWDTVGGAGVRDTIVLDGHGIRFTGGVDERPPGDIGFEVDVANRLIELTYLDTNPNANELQKIKAVIDVWHHGGTTIPGVRADLNRASATDAPVAPVGGLLNQQNMDGPFIIRQTDDGNPVLSRTVPSPARGEIRPNATFDGLEIWDGTTWQAA